MNKPITTPTKRSIWRVLHTGSGNHSRTLRPLFSLVGGLFCLGLLVACQTPQRDSEGQYFGVNLYNGYCASCHGTEGKGDGPVAPAMAFAMADLRTLEARRGEFPREWLREVIDGRTLRSVHGPDDMPVWGFEFRLAEESEAAVSARVEALIDYLERMQIRAD